MKEKVLIVGAGLAGTDAAWFLAERGVKVVLVEVKTLKKNPSQKLETFCELVCTNSLKSLNEASGHGILKFDMEALGSLVISCAKKYAVPAGDALAVDREKFSEEITSLLSSHKNIEVLEKDVIDPLAFGRELECSNIILATGPLTNEGLSNWIQNEVAEKDDFYFYDAIAPVVDSDSLNLEKLYYKDRYKDLDEENFGPADYLNAPMTKEEYEAFVIELKNAEKTPPKDFEEYKFFESCLPVDLMAERGLDTPRFSCMKPVGLEKDGKRPYAVVQLRRENLLGSAFNLVGFQTRLTYKEQLRVFRMIPGLEDASFVHLGSVHRNSFLNSKKLLNEDLSSKKYPHLYFAGQITGVEGYTESASMGLYSAFCLYRKMKGEVFEKWPVTTGIGCLVNYIMTIDRPSPSNINFGLLPPIKLEKKPKKRAEIKKLKKLLAGKRATEDRESFLKQLGDTGWE